MIDKPLVGNEDETRDREDTRALDAAEVQELAARMRADKERAALAAEELPPDLEEPHLEELAAEPTRVEDPEEERRAALAEIEARHRAELEREREREAKAGPSDIEALRRRVAQGRAERAAAAEREAAEREAAEREAAETARAEVPADAPAQPTAQNASAPPETAPKAQRALPWISLVILSVGLAGWAFWLAYHH